MAAQTVYIKSEFDSSKSVKGLVDIEKGAAAAAGSIAAMEAKAQKLKDKLKGLKVGSDAFKKLKKEAIQADSALKNATKSIEGLDTEGKAGELGKIAGGLGAIGTAGALAFGDNEDAEAFFRTFATGLAITNALKGAAEVYTGVRQFAKGVTIAGTLANVADNAVKETGTVITYRDAAGNITHTATQEANTAATKKGILQRIASTVATSAASGATKIAALGTAAWALITGASVAPTGAATVATITFGAALSAAIWPITLVVAAIAAIIAAFAYFSSSSESNAEVVARNEQANRKELEASAKAAEAKAARVGDALQQEIDLANIAGKNTADLAAKKIKHDVDTAASSKVSAKAVYDSINKEYLAQKKAGELSEEEFKTLRDELHAKRKDYDDTSKAVIESLQAETRALAKSVRNFSDIQEDARIEKAKRTLSDRDVAESELKDEYASRAAQARIEGKQAGATQAEIAATEKLIWNNHYYALEELKKEYYSKTKSSSEDSNTDLADLTEEYRLLQLSEEARELDALDAKYIKQRALAVGNQTLLKQIDDQELEEKSDVTKKYEDQTAEKEALVFERQQRIDAATIEAKANSLVEDDTVGLLAVTQSLHEEDIETLEFQLEQGEITKAEFDALEKARISKHSKEMYDIKKDAIDKEKADQKELNIQKVELASQGFAAVGALVNSFSAKNDKDARAQFKITKALNMGQTVTSTAAGIMNAYVNPVDVASGVAFAKSAIIATTGAASLVKIASSKFSPSGGGGGGAGNTGAPNNFQAPSASTGGIPTGFNNFNTTGGQDTQEAGTNQMAAPIVIQNNIVESDITSVQGTVASIEESSTFN